MKKFSLLESRQVILAKPSLMAGEYKQMPLEYKMCPPAPPSNPFTNVSLASPDLKVIKQCKNLLKK
jgi:hypothetical protein